MKAYSFSSLTLGGGGNGSDSAPVDEIVEDNLSIVGLNGEPTAFLKLEFECVECAIAVYPEAFCYAYALIGYTEYGPCEIYGPAISPLCTLMGSIVYNTDTEQPYPFFIERQLQVNAITNVTGAPAGVTVTTTVCVATSTVTLEPQ